MSWESHLAEIPSWTFWIVSRRLSNIMHTNNYSPSSTKHEQHQQPAHQQKHKCHASLPYGRDVIASWARWNYRFKLFTTLCCTFIQCIVSNLCFNMIENYLLRHLKSSARCYRQSRRFCVKRNAKDCVTILDHSYPTDTWTNATPKILSHIGRNLHLQDKHPLSLLRARLVNYMYSTYTKKGNPMFSVFDRLNPVVSTKQNFDSLLISPDHPSRQRSDCYYVNQNTLLRAHTTAHQAELLQSGLNSFLMVGDVYRRDEIDASHFPVFHQLDAVRLYSKHEVLEPWL